MIFHKFKKTTFILKKVFVISSISFLIYFAFCLPQQLFDQQYSKILLDRNGKLLEARIASDGQWRFPLIDSIPNKFEECILRFEDQHFYNHIGISLKGITRAIYLNLKEQKVVSGASTVTMQTIRLLRQNKSRTFKEKLIEMIWAVRLELKLSKREILRHYSTHAPFGGNVVGLETASWRYFNRPPSELTWAESAMLAVLPNAPGLIHLNKNRNALLNKRNRLLTDLFNDNVINEQTYKLAFNEPLPKPLHRLPHHSYHLVNRFANNNHRINSTINFSLQRQFNDATSNYSKQMKRKNIHNLSAVMIDVESGEILAYVGNIHQNNDEHAGKVDMMTSVRSSGSILKPLLYAAAVDDGVIAPKQLLPDFPISFSGYQPSNYYPEYDGMVPADEALYRSLNIPAAWLLKEYGNTKFKYELQQMGLKSINRSASDYGLSLILGGAEVNLLQLTGTYAALANKLKSGNDTYHTFSDFQHHKALTSHHIKYDAGSIYNTLTTLTNTYRPETEANWKNFVSSSKIAWKTGTSFGNRDAWAVGVTPQYAIGVWVGNSDGQGVSGLTGLSSAAPLLFQLVNLANTKNVWFHEPYNMTTATICQQSGMKATEHCTSTFNSTLPQSIEKTAPCKYHKTYLITQDQSARVFKQCYEGKTFQKSYFVLPPIAANYYQNKNPSYKTLPKLSRECQGSRTNTQVLYPSNKSRISLPKERNVIQQLNAKAFVQNSDSQLYWELNGKYLGQTTAIHEKTLTPKTGVNTLSLTDEDGNVTKTEFEVI